MHARGAYRGAAQKSPGGERDPSFAETRCGPGETRLRSCQALHGGGRTINWQGADLLCDSLYVLSPELLARGVHALTDGLRFRRVRAPDLRTECSCGGRTMMSRSSSPPFPYPTAGQ